MSLAQLDVPVRWSDLDAFGHLNHARLVTLLEEARVRWLFSGPARQVFDEIAQGVVVVSLAVTYRKPIGHCAAVSVTMQVSKLGTSSFTIDYQVFSDQQLAAEASTTLVALGADGQARPLRSAERDFLASYLSVPAQ